MIEILNKEDDKYLGKVSEEDLQFLIDNLEEDKSEDDDYYINRACLDMLKEKGLSASMAGIIEGAMSEKEEVEIRFKKAA